MSSRFEYLPIDTQIESGNQISPVSQFCVQI